MLARLLVPAQFGVVAAILIYLQFLELISDVGLAATVQYGRRRASPRGSRRRSRSISGCR